MSFFFACLLELSFYIEEREPTSPLSRVESARAAFAKQHSTMLHHITTDDRNTAAVNQHGFDNLSESPPSQNPKKDSEFERKNIADRRTSKNTYTEYNITAVRKSVESNTNSMLKSNYVDMQSQREKELSSDDETESVYLTPIRRSSDEHNDAQSPDSESNKCKCMLTSRRFLLT